MSFKKDFPIFRNRPSMIYLDSTATSLKPDRVIRKITEYYEQYSANVFRGLYPISERATDEFERVREMTSAFIGASGSDEIVFTRNTSESLNLLAYTLCENMPPDSEIAVTAMEHHSNFVPWQQKAHEKNLRFISIPFDTQGAISLETLPRYITPKTRVLACTHVSNVLGTVNPIQAISKAAKAISPNILIIVDAAQSAAHMPINVQGLGCDFLAFSSHKMFGPTGVGVLWGRRDILNSLPPFLYGGEMVEAVYEEKTVFKNTPHKFEAGTPAIGEVIGFGAAIEYIQSIGFEAIHEIESSVTRYAGKRLQETFGDTISLFGPDINVPRAPLFSFTMTAAHPHDIAQVLAEDDICIRAGSHCAMPLHTRLRLDSPASARASFSIYTEEKDIDALISGLQKTVQIFKK